MYYKAQMGGRGERKGTGGEGPGTELAENVPAFASEGTPSSSITV